MAAIAAGGPALVIDFAGNDHYRAGAVALLDLIIQLDLAGDDIYRAPRGGDGAAFRRHLRAVAVMGDAVGVHAFGDLAEQHGFLGRPPRPGDARFGVDDDVGAVDTSVLDQGRQRQQRAGGITARTGDDARIPDPRAPIP